MKIRWLWEVKQPSNQPVLVRSHNGVGWAFTCILCSPSPKPACGLASVLTLYDGALKDGVQSPRRAVGIRLWLQVQRLDVGRWTGASA